MIDKRIAVFDTKAEDCARTAAAVRAYYERRGEDAAVAELRAGKVLY